MNAPLAIVPKPVKKPKVARRRGLDAVTWDQRRKLTARQLIGLMGPLWVKHPQYKARPKAVSVHVPNLAGKQPVFCEEHLSFWRLVAQAFRWAMR